MTSNLYEVLEVARDASIEQIRKAYKKKALQTHPDRLPPGSTPEDKKFAEEGFRQVNHAYEILTDPEKRKEYDIHGVWPPPEPEEGNFEPFFGGGFPGRRHGQRSHAFPDLFGHRHHHHHHPFSGFAFRDPFELFESIFRDFDDDDFFGPSHVHPFVPLSPFDDMRGPRTHNLFNHSLFGPTLTPAIIFESSFENSRRRGGNYTSESYASTTVNGVTQTVHTRRDSEGNEHVTRTYNDGREVYTINGIEQPSHGALPQSTSEPRLLPQSSNSHYLPPTNPRPRRSYAAPQQRRPSWSAPQHPMTPYSQSRSTLNHHGGYNAIPPAQQSTQYNMPSQREYDAPPPPYPGSNNPHRDNYDRHNQASASAADHQRHRERRANDKYVPTNYGEASHEDRRSKKWLPRGFGRH